MEEHESILELGLARNTNFIIDWYYTHNIASSADTLDPNGRLQEKLLQVDVITKF